MQWRKLLAHRWPVMALALLGLFGAVAVAQSAANPFYFQATDKEDADESGWLGVYIEDITAELMKSEDLPSDDGVYVSGIVDDSPAKDAGLEEGDVILKFDGQEVRSIRRLTRMIEDAKPKTKVDIEILRDGAQRVLACEIGDDDKSVWVFGDDTGFDSPHVFVPRAPRAPDAPDAPDAPRAPHAYSFSLGQLSNSYIGVGLYDMSDELAAAMGATDGGALINTIEDDSPAKKAGLMAGDVIVAIDDKKVYDTDDVRKAIQKKNDGDVATVRVLRGNGEEKTVEVTVESNDTWSGIGAPQRFRVRPDNAGMFQWRDDLHDNLGSMRRTLKESGTEWREELEAEMKELREELRELREELRDNR